MTDTRDRITTEAERDVWAEEEMEWPWAMVTDAHGQPWIVYATEDDLFACTPPIEDERGLHAEVQVSDVIRHLDELDLPLTVQWRPDQPQRTEVTRPSDSEVVTAIGKGFGEDFENETFDFDAAVDAVLALFADQPTVAEVKAEALREFIDAMRGHFDWYAQAQAMLVQIESESGR